MAVSELIYSKGATGNISHLRYKHKTNLRAGLILPKKWKLPSRFCFHGKLQ